MTFCTQGLKKRRNKRMGENRSVESLPDLDQKLKRTDHLFHVLKRDGTILILPPHQQVNESMTGISFQDTKRVASMWWALGFIILKHRCTDSPWKLDSHYGNERDGNLPWFGYDFCRRSARYVDTFSAYARATLWGNMERPDIDKIDGLSPVISIEQRRPIRILFLRSVQLQKCMISVFYARAGRSLFVSQRREDGEIYGRADPASHSRKNIKEKPILLVPLVRNRNQAITRNLWRDA